MGRGLFGLVLLAWLAGAAQAAAPVLGFDVVAAYPHDTKAFTQGLVWDRGMFVEGTGLYGRSALRETDLLTGEVRRERALSGRYFGEGVTVLRDRIYQLTWRSGIGFVYDRDTLETLGSFRYRGAGWGLTHDGQHLIMSDGTAALRRLDPGTLQEIGSLTVTDGDTAVTGLNELEYVDDVIYANIWPTDRVVRIDPDSGKVLAWIDFKGLLGPVRRNLEAVLNGIAYDPEHRRLFVTGKLWPRLFEVRIRE